METLEAGPLLAAFIISSMISLATAVHRLAGGSRSQPAADDTEPSGAELAHRR